MNRKGAKSAKDAKNAKKEGEKRGNNYLLILFASFAPLRSLR
jgi:hypothetical protein